MPSRRKKPKREPTQREKDEAILAAGGDTGWWDETGQPAPWPEDFFDPETGLPDPNSGWREGGYGPDGPPEPEPGEPPF